MVWLGKVWRVSPLYKKGNIIKMKKQHWIERNGWGVIPLALLVTLGIPFYLGVLK